MWFTEQPPSKLPQGLKSAAEEMAEATQREREQREKDFLHQVARIREELLRQTAELEALKARLEQSKDALAVKDSMLESANRTIVQLKGSLAKEKEDHSETRRHLESIELELAEREKDDDERVRALREEIEAQEQTLEAMEAQLVEARRQADEAQVAADKIRLELKSKTDMINYVEEEVERVTALFKVCA